MMLIVGKIIISLILAVLILVILGLLFDFFLDGQPESKMFIISTWLLFAYILYHIIW